MGKMMINIDQNTSTMFKQSNPTHHNTLIWFMYAIIAMQFDAKATQKWVNNGQYTIDGACGIGKSKASHVP